MKVFIQYNLGDFYDKDVSKDIESAIGSGGGYCCRIELQAAARDPFQRFNQFPERPPSFTSIEETARDFAGIPQIFSPSSSCSQKMSSYCEIRVNLFVSSVIKLRTVPNMYCIEFDANISQVEHRFGIGSDMLSVEQKEAAILQAVKGGLETYGVTTYKVLAYKSDSAYAHGWKTYGSPMVPVGGFDPRYENWTLEAEQIRCGAFSQTMPDPCGGISFKFPSSSAYFAPAHNPQSIVIDPKTEALFDHTELFLGERGLTEAIKNSWVFLEYRGNQPMVLAFVAPNNSEESKSLLLRLSVYLSQQNFEVKPIDTDEDRLPRITVDLRASNPASIPTTTLPPPSAFKII